MITHCGTFKYTRMPFGIKSAPSAFQRIINAILGNQQGVLCYLDDILVSGTTRSELREKLQSVLTKLRAHNVKINEDKSVKEATRLEWLGHEISARGIQPAANQVEKISRLKPPLLKKK